MERHAPITKSGIKHRPSKRKPMPADVVAQVYARDGDCRAHAMGFALDSPCFGRPHVHHRKLRSQGGEHSVENCMLICDHHHHLAHRVRRAEAEAAGVILRSHN